MLTRDELLKPRVRVETVTLADGSKVGIRVMSGLDRDSFEAEQLAHGNTQHMAVARLLVRCLCDADGARLFRDDETEQLAAALDADSYIALGTHASRVNGYTTTAVEETRGNSAAAPSD